MTQTTNRFFDEMARLMNDAAGVALGRAARVRHRDAHPGRAHPARPRRGQARGIRGGQGDGPARARGERGPQGADRGAGGHGSARPATPTQSHSAARPIVCVAGEAAAAAPDFLSFRPSRRYKPRGPRKPAATVAPTPLEACRGVAVAAVGGLFRSDEDMNHGDRQGNEGDGASDRPARGPPGPSVAPAACRA